MFYMNNIKGQIMDASTNYIFVQRFLLHLLICYTSGDTTKENVKQYRMF